MGDRNVSPVNGYGVRRTGQHGQGRGEARIRMGPRRRPALYSQSDRRPDCCRGPRMGLVGGSASGQSSVDGAMARHRQKNVRDCALELA